MQVLTGRGYFEGSRTLRVETAEGQRFVTFEKAIIAVGSKAALPKLFDLGNPRIMTSTEALEVEEIPEDLLVVGGGYIGMELGSVYANLGSKVVVVEALQSILSGADPDLVRPVLQYAQKTFRELRFNTKVTQMSTKGKKIRVVTQGPDKAEKEELFDRVLVSVGRVPRCQDLGLENTKVSRTSAASSRSTTNRKRTIPPSWPSAILRAASCWRTRRPRKRASRSRPSRASKAVRRASSFRPWSSPTRSWPGAA